MKRLHGCGLALIGSLFVPLIAPLLVPVPALKDALPPEALADSDSQFVEINGIRVHLKTLGRGEPVFVLLHGFAASLYSWHSVMEPLSQFGTVIAYDRTGFGLTERPLSWQGPNPYAPEAQLDLLAGLLDQFGVQEAILVGNSAGGTVAMQFALLYPQRVRGLVLVDPAVYLAGTPSRWLQPLLATPQMRHLGPLICRQLLARGSKIIDKAWHDTSLVTPEMQLNYRKPYRVEGWDKALWEFMLASRPAGLADRLDELTVPAVVITGDDDRIIPTVDSIRLASELPNAELELIPQSGHMPQEEQPQKFMQAVERFLIHINSAD